MEPCILTSMQQTRRKDLSRYAYRKGVIIGVCDLRSVTESSQNRREKSTCLLENNDLDTGEKLLINALHHMKNETQSDSLRAT